MSLHKDLLKNSLPPLLPQTSRNQRFKKDYSLKSWEDYFDGRRNIVVGKNNFNIYEKGKSGVLIVLLHGGGFSALTWALFCQRITSEIECHCVAIDLRGHGLTSTEDDSDLSVNTLASDVCDVINELDTNEKVVLVGHSMGGAVAVHSSVMNRINLLSGLIVIDVVEGTALDSLHMMRSIIANRPTMFKSIEHANQWCIKSGYIRNLESVRVSMIGQLVEEKLTSPVKISSSCNSLTEEPTTLVENNNTCLQKTYYKWRIDLSSTEKYWHGWFKGLSQLFLSSPVPKVLMLAGTDRLDKDLTIGQMQGKFQMVVLPKSGHAVHEDAPEKVANSISSFLIRHKIIT